MYRVFTASCLLLASMPALVSAEGAGEEYRTWCARSAKAEKIAQQDQAAFIQRCIDNLVEADSRPDKSDSKRNKARQDEAD